MYSKLPLYLAIFLTVLLSAGLKSSPQPSDHLTGATTGFTSSTGVTGGSTGGGVNVTLQIVDLFEKKSATSYKLDSGGTTYSTLTNRHVAGPVVKYSVSTTADTSTTRNHNHSERIAVPIDTELGEWSGHTPTAGTLPTSSGSVNVLFYTVSTDGVEIPIQISSTGALSSQTIHFYIVVHDDWEDWDPGTNSWVYHDSDGWSKCTVDLTKVPVGDASIDTRKHFGQPNIEGASFPDANDPATNVKFGNWVFKGGLFVGNALPYTGDRSGLARTQLWPQPSGSFTNPIMASLVLYDQGHPRTFSGSLDVGLFIPGSSDSNLSVTEGDCNWSNRWTITPHAFSSSATDWTQYPLSVRSLSGDGGDYINWRLFGINSQPAGIPSRGLSNICLASTDESTLDAWRYFASQEYQEGSTFPRNDCAPRVWVADMPTTPDTYSW